MRIDRHAPVALLRALVLAANSRSLMMADPEDALRSHAERAR